MSALRMVALCVAAMVFGAASPSAAWSPAVNYALNCQGCHLADGSATPDLVPAIRGAVGRFARVPEGRAYMIRLPNVAATALGDAEVAALLNWVVSTFGGDEVPAEFAPFTAAEVADRRGDVLVDVEGERRAVLAAIATSSSSPRGDGSTGDRD